MTLLQLADVSHFPSGASGKTADQQEVERAQRMFWLPEIGRVIARFSTRTETTLHNTRVDCWGEGPAIAPSPRRKPRAQFPASVESEGLDSRAFESTLDALLNIVGSDDGGWLLVSRNEIPPVFLGLAGFRAHARAVHHSEELVARYVQELRARERRLLGLARRMTLLIPEQSADWFIDEELRQKLFARSETPGAAHIPTAGELKKMLAYFSRHWAATDAVSLVKANEYNPDDLGRMGLIEARELRMDRVSLTMLPDVWIAIGPALCERLRGSHIADSRDDNELAVVRWAAGLTNKDSLYVSLLDDSLRNQEIVALKVSAAEFNPRYRGHTLTSPEIGRALRHWALAYCAAKRVKGIYWTPKPPRTTNSGAAVKPDRRGSRAPRSAGRPARRTPAEPTARTA